MGNLRVAIIQMDVTLGDPEANEQRVRARLSEVAESRPDLVVLPEMWNTGYALRELKKIADKNGDRTVSLLREYALRHNYVIVGGSVAEWREDRAYNTTYVIGRDGAVCARYSKIHRFQLMDEHLYLEEGKERALWHLDDWVVGQMICYDLRFPELARTYALLGSNLLVLPAEWPHPRLAHWRTLNIARAIENQMYVVACNRVGQSDGTSFFGHSMVVDPWGEVMLEGDEEEHVYTVEIDAGRVQEVRKQIPIFADRRPPIYQLD